MYKRQTKVLAFRGLERTAVDLAEAGDIVALAGITEATVADTLCDPSVDTPFLAQPVDPPTLSMTFRINDGPFAGQEGDKVQSRVIRDRLMKEAALIQSAAAAIPLYMGGMRRPAT